MINWGSSGEYASFWDLPLNGFICTPDLLKEYIYIYIYIYHWEKRPARVMRILRESRWWSFGDHLIIFILNCSTEYFFLLSTWNYFPLLLWCVLYMPFDSNFNARNESSGSHFYGFHDHVAPFSFLLCFKIFIFADFIVLALFHPAFIWNW